MNYEQALEYIDSFPRFGKAVGLDNIIKLLKILGDPQEHCKVLHIAGTNGKGSVAAIAAEVLIKHGYKTGLYVSPYIINFRERIQINGEMISENRLAECCAEVKATVGTHFDDAAVFSQFEIITAIGFLYFAHENCNYIILETGLGGRLDATNVVKKPICTVITHISLDHTAVLGETTEEIAAEKAGIIKKNVPVVVSPQCDSAFHVIAEKCKEQNARLVAVKENDITDIKLGFSRTDFKYLGTAFSVSLAGEHQAYNAATALEMLKQTGISLNPRLVAIALNSVIHPARLEVVSESPPVIIDGAHNPDGITALCEYIKNINWQGSILFGALKDKNTEEMVHILSSLNKEVVTVTIRNNERAESAVKLAADFDVNGIKAMAAKNYEEAIKYLSKKPFLVCGSLYLAADIRKIFKNDNII